jgi:hypothetical protein
MPVLTEETPSRSRSELQAALQAVSVTGETWYLTRVARAIVLIRVTASDPGPQAGARPPAGIHSIRATPMPHPPPATRRTHAWFRNTRRGRGEGVPDGLRAQARAAGLDVQGLRATPRTWSISACRRDRRVSLTGSGGGFPAGR